MKKFLKMFKKDEKGQGLVEYGLIIGLIVVIVIAAFIALKPQLTKMFSTSADQIKAQDAENAKTGTVDEGATPADAPADAPAAQ